MDKLKYKFASLSKELSYISDVLNYQDESTFNLKEWEVAYTKILQELSKVYEEIIATSLSKEDVIK